MELPSPFVLDTTAARALGWQPPRYADAVRPEVDWLLETAHAVPAGGDVPWAQDPFWDRMFDYGPEDAALVLLSLGRAEPVPRSEVLFVGGRSGVGKSTAAEALHDLLAAADVPHAVIEGDLLDLAHPAPHVAHPTVRLADGTCV